MSTEAKIEELLRGKTLEEAQALFIAGPTPSTIGLASLEAEGIFTKALVIRTWERVGNHNNVAETARRALGQAEEAERIAEQRRVKGLPVPHAIAELAATLPAARADVAALTPAKVEYDSAGKLVIDKRRKNGGA